MTPAPAFRLDEEFSTLCPVVDREERELLRASLLAHGVREPLVVWKEERLLLDGHRRLLLCREHEIEPTVVEYSFPDRDAARRWVIDNALGRRNLTREQRDYLIGKRYLAEKKPHGGERAASPQSEDLHPKTAERIAAQAGVSRATVERAADYAAAVDRISETCPKARTAILTGKVKLTRDEVARAAEKAPRSLAQVKRAAAAAPRARAATPRRDERDLVLDVTTHALRTAAAIESLTKAGVQPADRPRLRALWDLRSAIDALDTALTGEE